MSETTFYYDQLASPIGTLRLVADEDGLRRICFESDAHPRPEDSGGERCPERLAEARRQLCEYFAGERRRFSLPLSLSPSGTAFQRLVWQSLANIEFGSTRSYAQLAAAIGRGGAYRAVGGANARNPIPIVLPCHRVIGTNGSLTGFAGGMETKRWLLAFEQRAGVEPNNGDAPHR